MNHNNFKNYLITSSILAGTILGVGIFGLPYVFSKAGFLAALLFLFVCLALVLINHLIYGEALLRTKGDHRLPGLAKIYLGKIGFFISSLSVIISDAAILLAYLILGGQFVQNIFQYIGIPQGIELSSVVFWILGTIGIIFGIGFIGVAEILSIILIIAFIIGFFALGAPHINIAWLNKFNISQMLLPYGILLFSLSDGASVPEIFDFFKKKKIPKSEINFKKPIIWGTMLPPILYLMFILGAYGLFKGQAMTVNLATAISQIHPLLGLATNILGIILILTSYFVIGLSYRKILFCDLKLQKGTSLIVPVFIPIILFLMGINNFIGVIDFIGAFLLGILITITVIIHKKSQKYGELKPPYQIKIPGFARIILILLLLTGVGLEIAKFFK